MQHAPLAYLNGDYLPFTELKLPVYDLGIVQGATVTERLRTFHQQAFLVDEHLARLRNSLSAIGLEKKLCDSLDEVIQKLVRQHASQVDKSQELSVVIFITAGSLVSDSNGLIQTSTPTVCVYTNLLSLDKWKQGYQRGVHLMTSNVRQIPENVLSPRIKMRSRLHWYLADQEVRNADPQAMAILLDQDGYLTESSSGNLFMVKDQLLYTPTAVATLPGITQDYVIELAKQLKIPVQRSQLLPGDLESCDEAFLTSSTYCILPVSRFNSSAIGSGDRREITQALSEQFEKQVGCCFRQ